MRFHLTDIRKQLAYDGSYEAPPVDVWGAGIIMFTLLVGSTPWDEASVSSPEFMDYVKGEIWSKYPWSKIGSSAKGKGYQHALLSLTRL